MTFRLRNSRPDKPLRQIAKVLEKYAAEHPHADVEAFRHNEVSVKIRVIDPGFEGMSPAEREEDLWKGLKKLPEEVLADVSMLLLLTPKEAKQSVSNLEFDSRTRSRV